jgi:hypothetical protein
VRASCAFAAGEIESAAGHQEQAERHYDRAIGVATVGLLTVRAAGQTTPSAATAR